MNDGEELFGSLIRFGQHLRSHRFAVGPGRILAFCKAAAELDPTDPADLYWAGRLTLVDDFRRFGDYDRAFDEWFTRSEQKSSPRPGEFVFGGWDDEGAPLGTQTVSTTQEVSVVDPSDDGPSSSGPTASEDEILKEKRFDHWSEEDLRRLHQMVAGIAVNLPKRVVRRTRPGPSGRIDLRRTVRRSLRSDGEPFHRAFRRRRIKPRRLVLILDISGSMAGFSRPLLHFAYATHRAAHGVEVFCFGTRLTRITPQLRWRDPNRSIEEAASRVIDWESGTRIGESLSHYVRRYGLDSRNRGSVVLICSDGLERGDPQTLGTAMARLARQAHRVIWVNPLMGDPGFRPLTRGLIASLPHIDSMVAGHNLSALDQMAGLLTE
ncbi:MAG: VWA domain-containing protein [Actinomycetia bacterium]|nr:VWA domain-containing protein [Actinomycetes bacterium]